MVETTIASGYPKEASPNAGIKKVLTKTAATNSGYTLPVITLADYGISKFVGINGYVMTTEDSIIVPEAPTTSVTTGVLTITVGGTGVNGVIRYYEIIGV